MHVLLKSACYGIWKARREEGSSGTAVSWRVEGWGPQVRQRCEIRVARIRH